MRLFYHCRQTRKHKLGTNLGHIVAGVLVNALPGKYTFVAKRGAVFARTIAFKNARTGKFVDVTGFNAEFSVFTFKHGPLAIPKLTTQLGNIIILTSSFPTGGPARFQIDPLSTFIDALPYGRYWYEFNVFTRPPTFKSAVGEGPFIVD